MLIDTTDALDVIYDTPSAILMMIVSDAPSCGVTYNHHSDNSRGVIYATR